MSTLEYIISRLLKLFGHVIRTTEFTEKSRRLYHAVEQEYEEDNAQLGKTALRHG